MAMWRSKLGAEYTKASIDKLDAQYHRELKTLRLRNGPNSCCADCGSLENNWCSVNLGVFVCTMCASVHRGFGTHISKTKSCMGSYLWGPDEMEVMRNGGNVKGNAYWLAHAPASALIGPDASDSDRARFGRRKYVDREFIAGDSELNRNLTVSLKPTADLESVKMVPTKAKAEMRSTSNDSRGSAATAKVVTHPDFFLELFPEEAEKPTVSTPSMAPQLMAITISTAKTAPAPGGYAPLIDDDDWFHSMLN